MAANDILLGTFFTSDSDHTNGIYVSYDGKKMTRVATTYDTKGHDGGGGSFYYDSNKNAHYGQVDPSIMYYGGKFWSLSGWNRYDGKFWPMISYSTDLVHWTHPEGDGLLSGTHGIALNAYPSGYSSKKKDFDTVAPEWFISKNGSVYIVFSAGYYGAFHGEPTKDRMQAYMVKVTKLSAKAGTADGKTKYLWPNGLTFTAGKAMRLNIPGNTAKGADYIDGALFVDGKTDYLVIKKGGLTNQVYKTSNIDKNAWTLINKKATYGYEGGSIAKLGGTYFMAADRVAGATANGVRLFKSSSLTKQGWDAAGTKFVTKDGKTCKVRHGSIIVLKAGTAGWKAAANLLKTNLSSSTVASIANQAYTSKAVKPVPTVKVRGTALKNGTDFTLKYANNVKRGTATVTITGKGGYTGSKKVTFKIVQANVSKASVATIANQAYTGSAVKPALTVKMSGVTLKSGTDYTLAYANNVKRGTATVTITGKGFYTGSKKATFKIVQANVSKASVATIANKTYTGAAIKPALTVKMGSVTLKNGTDYTFAYANNTAVGTATITITGKGNYTGTKKVTFKIVKASLATATVAQIANKTYTGAAFKPTPEVKLGTKVLKNGTDYSLAYTNNINSGTATVTVTGKGGYQGSKQAKFTIVAAAISAAEVSVVANQTYTGQAIVPKPVVRLNGATLVEGSDYVSSYGNNTNAGTATVTFTGKGNYRGTTQTQFNIVAADISAAEVLAIDPQVYTGEAIEPKPVVRLGGVVLAEGTDYELTYNNNAEVGTATLTVAGVGNYQGSTQTEFEIVQGDVANPIDISAAEVSEIDLQVYTGEAIEPKPVVRLDGVVLAEGTDYELTYENNIEVGKATITISGMGDYQGSTQVEFEIVSNADDTESQTDSNSDSGQGSGSEQGSSPGQGSNPDANSGSDSNADSGTDQGSDPDDEPVAEPSSDPSPEHESDSESEA